MEHPIFTRIATAPKPDFGGILTKTFDSVQLLWQPALFHGLISMLLFIPFLLVLYVPLAPVYIGLFENFGASSYQPDLSYSVSFWVGYMVAAFVLALIVQLFNFAVVAHFYNLIKLTDSGITTKAGGYFVYLKGNIGKILLCNLAAMGIAIIAALLCYLPVIGFRNY